MKLPETPHKPNNNGLPEGIVYFIYGNPKVGKSTLASQFPKPLFLATEPGLSGLGGIYHVPITTAGEIRAVHKLLEADGASFRTLVIDTIDRFVEIVQDGVCRKLGARHPADLGYGRGWYEVRRAVMEWLLKFGDLGRTLVLISHARERIDETAQRPPRITPNLSNSLSEAILSWCDVILYCQVDKDGDGKPTHRINSQGSSILMAGSRFPQLVGEFEMGFDSIERCFKASNRNRRVKSQTR